MPVAIPKPQNWTKGQRSNILPRSISVINHLFSLVEIFSIKKRSSIAINLNATRSERPGDKDAVNGNCA